VAKLLHRLLPAALRRKVALWPHRQAQARLVEALRAPHAAQRRALDEIVRRNQHTEFGRTHGFARVTGLADFASRVPLRDYRDLEPYLRRQVDGEPDVLVAGPLEGLAPDETDGRHRLLPLSRAGLDQRLWVEQILRHEVLSTRLETSGSPWLHVLPRHDVLGAEALGVEALGVEALGADLTPSLAAEVTTLPPHEAGRLMAPVAALLSRTRYAPADSRALPLAVFTLRDEELRFYLLLRLALHQRFSVLRAANPGTLLILAEHLEDQAPRLLDDLAAGVISRRDELPAAVAAALPAKLKARPQLAAELRQQRAAHGRLEARHVWPDLGALVCDIGGPARAAAERLPDRFGDATVVDSGYASAEGVLTLPTAGDEGGLALLERQLLEFLPAADEEGAPTLPADGLRLGDRYLPVLTSHNGLYRYVLDQEVEVTEIDGGTPRLVRVGRRRTRLPLGRGTLDATTVQQALLEACRSVGFVPSQQTCWLQPVDDPAAELAAGDTAAAAEHAAQGDAPAAGSTEKRPSFWSRLFSFGRSARKDAHAARVRTLPTLTWALETEGTLESAAAKKLLAAAEAELKKACDAYAKERGASTLDSASLLVLRPGTFARHARQRLAEGAAHGHLSPPMLREAPWQLADDEIDTQL